MLNFVNKGLLPIYVRHSFPDMAVEIAVRAFLKAKGPMHINRSWPCVITALKNWKTIGFTIHGLSFDGLTGGSISVELDKR